MKESKNQKNQGITLIALVITIIVLLILAGVSIAMLTGENGILTQAQRAKKETENAQKEEESVLENYEQYIEGSTNGGTLTKVTGNETTNTTVYDSLGNKVVVPAGFKVVNPGDNVEDGIIIEDVSAKDNITVGNQFVWIPVDGMNLKYEKHAYVNAEIDDTNTTIDTGNRNWITQNYRKYSNRIDNEKNPESVEKYGGFYVARYEAGVPENANFYASKDGDTYYTSETNPSKNVTTYIPVSKKGYPVWNYISIENAKIVASKMYNTTSIKSSLIDSYAWDTITQWLDNSGYNVTDSRSWGNYYSVSFDYSGLYAAHAHNAGWGLILAQTYNKGSTIKNSDTYFETATGNSERNKANNIYDFAGNFFEWTTETTAVDSNIYAVSRGGGMDSGNAHAAACLRISGEVNNKNLWHNTFRVVLYLK